MEDYNGILQAEQILFSFSVSVWFTSLLVVLYDVWSWLRQKLN